LNYTSPYSLPSTVEKIINYVRKSRDEELQEEKDPSFNALERQRMQMENVLKRYGIPFEQEKETGSGDKIESRPVFRRILNDIRSNKYQAIAVREIARLGRGSYEDMGQIYSLLEEKRIYIITENRVWDLRNPDDAKFIRMQLFMSREEYFMIKERLQGAKEFFAREGKFMSSRPPYGYVSNPKTKVLEIDHEKAKVIKLIFQWYAEGLGYQAIATKVSTFAKTYTGLKTWQPLHISRILKNRTYVGEIVYKATERVNNKQIARPREEWIVVPDAHEAIIDIELFEAVQNKLTDKKKNIPVRLEFDPCELAGIINCTCGKKMVRQYSVQHYKKENGETSIYHKEFLYCKYCKVSVKYRDVEGLILNGLKELCELSDDLLKESLSQVIQENNKLEIEVDSESIIQMLEKQRKQLSERLKSAYEYLEDGIYTKDEFIKRRDSIQDELSKVETEIKNESNKVRTIEESLDISLVKANITTALESYPNLNNKTLRNELLRHIIEYVVVEIKEKGIGRKPSTLRVYIELNYVFLESAIK
jgi:site-specific DNA recombinase